MAESPWRHVRLGPRGDVVEYCPDGSILLRSPERLAPYPRSCTERLQYWAAAAPDRLFIAERDDAGAWRRVGYRDAFDTVCRIAQALLDRGLSAERPVMVLSGNSIAHALIGLAAMHVGIPYVPVSVPFSLASKDHEKLRHVAGLVWPGLVFADSGVQFQRAIAAAIPADAEVVVSRDPVHGGQILFEKLAGTQATDAVEKAAAAVQGDTVAKILFTSGSTAMPKGVINPHRMLCANQQMASQVWPFLQDTPPMVVDWLPWNHTFGGNFVVGNTLFHGGSLYIDDGRPVGADILKSVRNLADISPTVHFNVPKGYEMLLPYLAADRRLAESFFGRMQMMFYAAAGLPQAAWDELRRLAIQTTGMRIFTTSTLGSTETAPLAITANWDADRPGIIGLPVPGVEVKLVPVGRRLEFKVRGPNVTPGYWKQPDKTRAAFDADGWYSLGDAVRFADPDDPSQGLVFDSRLAEDFKLSTGVWVHVGAVRAQAGNHLFPLVRDFVVCGRDRDEIGLLIFPDFDACRQFAALPAEATADEIVTCAAVHREFRRRLDAAASGGASSSSRVVRALVLADHPHPVEVTDKGSLAYNLVVERRAAEIAELYHPAGSPRVLVARQL